MSPRPAARAPILLQFAVFRCMADRSRSPFGSISPFIERSAIIPVLKRCRPHRYEGVRLGQSYRRSGLRGESWECRSGLVRVTDLSEASCTLTLNKRPNRYLAAAALRIAQIAVGVMASPGAFLAIRTGRPVLPDFRAYSALSFEILIVIIATRFFDMALNRVLEPALLRRRV